MASLKEKGRIGEAGRLDVQPKTKSFLLSLTLDLPKVNFLASCHLFFVIFYPRESPTLSRCTRLRDMLYVGLWMEHAVGGIAHPLASKRAGTPHFRGVDYICASSTLIGSLSTFMCQSRNPFLRVLWLTPPWHVGVQNTESYRRYQSVGVNLDCEVSPTG